jgi:hypothetical protein
MSRYSFSESFILPPPKHIHIIHNWL